MAPEAPAPEPPAPSPSPSAQALGRELTDAVREALALLPDDQQTVIRMTTLQHLTIAEVARRLDRSYDSVKGLQSRGLKRLAEILGLGDAP